MENGELFFTFLVFATKMAVSSFVSLRVNQQTADGMWGEKH